MKRNASERGVRKRLGAFYSPRSLVEPLVGWALTDRRQAVLDPSCGDGVFLECASRRLLQLGVASSSVASRVHGIDLDADAARRTHRTLRAVLGLRKPDIRAACFFALAPPGGPSSRAAAVDAVIGNPPYIRYQHFSGKVRELALRRAREAGVSLSRLTSSWAPFVVHATSFVRPGGRLAFILPAELIHTAYAAPLRRFLREAFARLHVISFRKAVFPQVEEEVVILLAEGKGEEPAGGLGLVQIEDGAGLARIDEVLAREERFEAGVEPMKWVAGSQEDPGTPVLERLATSGAFHPVGKLGKANIGFVSGANEFFVVTPDEAAFWRLPEGSLQPALIRARQIPGMKITHTHFSRLLERGERCLLWKPGAQLTKEEAAYVRYGENAGIHLRYKCRTRAPWYLVPGVMVPDAFLTYMADVVPRLCLNRAGAASANTLLTVRLGDLPRRLHVPFAVAYYNSATLLSCERIGRSYGGGVLKLEPREADRLLIPGRGLLERHRKRLCALAGLVDEALRKGGAGNLRAAVAAVDGVLFGRMEDVGGADLERLSRSREALLDRRRMRARPSFRRVDGLA